MHLSRRSAILALIVLAAILAIAWFAVRAANPLPQTYRNTTYGFSLRLPADYAVTEAPNTNPREENGVADIIEFEDKSGSVQLIINYVAAYQRSMVPQSYIRQSRMLWLNAQQSRIWLSSLGSGS